MDRIISEHRVIAGVPALIVAPEDARHLPTVIYAPGFGQDKDSGMEIAHRLAEQGLVCVSIDLAMHGERDDGRLKAAFDPGQGTFPPESGLDVGFTANRCIVETAEDIGRLIGALTSDERVDATRLGVCGFSLGGVIAYYATARYPAVKAAAPIHALPSQFERFDDIVFETSLVPEWGAAITAQREKIDAMLAYVRENDPSAHLTEFAPKPLLIVNGDLDTDMPKLYSLRLARRLQPFYAEHPERLRVYLPPVEHRLTSGILREVAGWFARCL